MSASTFLSPEPTILKPRKFAHRSLLPLERDYLWQISTGVVRTVTYSEDGIPMTLGLWGSGDVVGRVLSRAEPFQIECFTAVEAIRLPVGRWYEATDAMILHIQQFQEFLEILHCRNVDASLMRLLSWLAKKFGREIEQGKLIDLRLTHEEIASIMGTTRVTVTRVLKDFEQRGIIQRLPQHLIVLHEQEPFWHYEI